MNPEEETAEEDDDDINYETGFHSDSYDIIVHEIIVKADFDSKSSKQIYHLQYFNTEACASKAGIIFKVFFMFC